MPNDPGESGRFGKWFLPAFITGCVLATLIWLIYPFILLANVMQLAAFGSGPLDVGWSVGELATVAFLIATTLLPWVVTGLLIASAIACWGFNRRPLAAGLATISVALTGTPVALLMGYQLTAMLLV